MRRFLFFAISFFAAVAAVSQSNRITQEYTSSDALFPNPERGFYRQHACNLGTGTGALTLSSLQSYRNDNISLILRLYYLKNFKNSPLSEEALTMFNNDMAVLRKAGLKCMLRFAYSEGSDDPDAPLAVISQHLDQLKPYLEKNKDVIAFMQAGFIGAWGEWHASTNGLDNNDGRNAVLSKILQTLPEDRIVQVRTPAYKKNFLERTSAIKREEAFGVDDVARIGHHNDCFLASPNDYGTYVDVDADKAYLNRECLYLPIGGETCTPYNIEPADGEKAYNEMSYLRWTYLNRDYYLGVNDLWIPTGHMDKIG